MVAVSLTADPGGGIPIPVVPLIGNRADRRLDGIPSALVIEGATDEGGDECAPAAAPDSRVQFRHDVVLKDNV